MEGILNGLTNLNLQAARPILADRTNARKASETGIGVDKPPTKIPTPVAPVTPVYTFDTAGSEATNSLPRARYGMPKARVLADLTRKASAATDNGTLASLVKEFARALQMNSSRTLTKEASAFLDVLHNRLDDPSVFIQPTR